MTPRVGDVFIVDLGYDGKVRPVVVVSSEDDDAPRALSIAVPLTCNFAEAATKSGCRAFRGSSFNPSPMCRPSARRNITSWRIAGENLRHPL